MAQVVDLLLRPFVGQILAEHLGERLVAALARELDLVEGTDVPKRAEFAVQMVFNGIPFSGVKAGNPGRNRRGVQEFEDTDALIALLDVKPMHELGDDDGVAIALGHLDVVEVGPLAGEFGVKRQQRHKIARKGGLTALELNVPQADALAFATGKLGNEAIEVREIRMLTLADGATASLLAALACLTISLFHGFAPLVV